MQIVKDGRSDYVVFMDQLEVSTIYFSMINTANGIPKVVSAPANIVEKTFAEPGTPVEYYVYFQFTSTMTNTPGRYIGQFLIKNDEGNLILPIREELYINVQPSFISESPCC
jgi:GH25 family lysozyme M1 (1,4-beta-N-acetylmuramidase)